MKLNEASGTGLIRVLLIMHGLCHVKTDLCTVVVDVVIPLI